MFQKLEKKIEKLKEKDMSLDELNDEYSCYILLDKYIKKFSQAWKLYCKLTSRGSGTGRPVQRAIKFNGQFFYFSPNIFLLDVSRYWFAVFLRSGTRFPDVNECIEIFLNKNKNSFPDFCDVLNRVSEVNEQKHLNFRPSQCHDLGNFLCPIYYKVHIYSFIMS